MAKENEDLNKGQPVTGQDLTAQPVTGSSVSGSAGGQQEATVLADGTNQDKDVPYGRFKEANEAKKAAEEAQRLAEQEAQQTRDQMALMQASQVQAQQPAQAPPQSTYEQAAKDLGYDPEFMDEAQRVQVHRRMEQLNVARTQQQQMAVASQQFANSHSDFGTAVGQMNVAGQFIASAELQKILMEKPHLRASCNTAAGAYQVVMDQRKVAELTQKAQAAEEQEIKNKADAKTGPMSLAAVGGGAIDRTAGLITESSTAADVLKVKEQIERGEFD